MLVGIAAIVLWHLAAPAASAKKKPRQPPPPPSLASRVKYLAEHLYGVPLDESAPITGQIERLVFDDLDQWIVAHPPGMAGGPSEVPYEVQVRRRLEAAFAELHDPLLGIPSTFAAPWQEGQLVGAGYTLGWTDQDRTNVLALYASVNGKMTRVTLTHFIPRSDLHYAFLPSPAPDEFRVLVYGTRLGKSHPRLSAVLYAFDGHALKPLWKIEDVYDGRLTVDRDRVVIRYLNEEELIQSLRERTPVPQHEAIYRADPAGLTLEVDHQVAGTGR